MVENDLLISIEDNPNPMWIYDPGGSVDPEGKRGSAANLWLYA